MKSITVLYIYTYEDSIMKSTTHWLDREGGGNGEWKCSRGSELVQRALNVCMELSQQKPLVSLMYANSKL
jgi:hypothetical protein